MILHHPAAGGKQDVCAHTQVTICSGTDCKLYAVVPEGELLKPPKT